MDTLISIILLVLSINGEALSWNPTLKEVGYKRQYRPDLVRKIPRYVDVDRYQCRVAVPYKLNELVGREVYFLSNEGVIHGPWLITDYESPMDYYDGNPMEENNLLADVDCQWAVHKKGKLLLAEYHRFKPQDKKERNNIPEKII